MLSCCTVIGSIKVMPREVKDAKGIKRMMLTLAVERPFRNVDGITEIDDFEVEFWKGIAEETKDRCSPGAVLAIKGRLEVHPFLDEQMKTVNKVEIIAENVVLLSSRIISTAKAQHLI